MNKTSLSVVAAATVVALAAFGIITSTQPEPVSFNTREKEKILECVGRGSTLYHCKQLQLFMRDEDNV